MVPQLRVLVNVGHELKPMHHRESLGDKHLKLRFLFSPDATLVPRTGLRKDIGHR